MKTPNFLTAAAVAFLSMITLVVQGQQSEMYVSSREMAEMMASRMKSDLQITYDDTGGVVRSIKIENDRRMIKVKGKWGFENAAGKIVIPCTHDLCHDFYGKYAVVGKEGPKGYRTWHIDLNGKPLYVTTLYVDVHHFTNGYAVVDITGEYQMCHIDQTGKPIYAQRYTYCWDFNAKGRAIVQKVMKGDRVMYSVITTSGEVLGSKEYKHSDQNIDMDFDKKMRADMAQWL